MTTSQVLSKIFNIIKIYYNVEVVKEKHSKRPDHLKQSWGAEDEIKD